MASTETIGHMVSSMVVPHGIDPGRQQLLTTIGQAAKQHSGTADLDTATGCEGTQLKDDPKPGAACNSKHCGDAAGLGTDRMILMLNQTAKTVNASIETR